MRQQATEWANRAKDAGPGAEEVTTASSSLIEDLNAAEKRLMKVGLRGALDRPNMRPTINTRLAELCEVVAVADFAPPRQAYDVFDVLSRRAGKELADLRELIDTGVAELDRLIGEYGVPNIASPSESQAS